jgi:hypothetical protein
MLWRCSRQVADFVALFDGKKTLAEVADRFAAALRVDAGLVLSGNWRIAG